MTLKITFDSPPDEWSALLATAGREAGFCQSSTWGRILKRLDNSRPIYLSNESFGLQLFHRIPYDRENGKISWKTTITGRANGWLTWSDGPFFLSNDVEKNKSNLIEALQWIEDFRTTNHLSAIQCNGLSQSGSHASDEVISEGFSQFHYDQTSWGTYFVDLTVDEESLRKSFESSGRKSINKAIREGLIVNELLDWDSYYSHFLIPYREAEVAAGRTPPPEIASRITWEEDLDKNYHYFAAFNPDGEILGVLGMICFNQTAVEIVSAISPLAAANKIPAQDILHWEIFRAAKALGCTRFNLAGVNPDPQTPKERGIRQFKAKWGGEYSTYFRFNKQFPTTLQKLIQQVRSPKKH